MYWEQHEQRLSVHRHKFDHRALHSLSLRGNKFGKGGLKAICHPAIGQKLRDLNLSDNDIGTGGAMAILGAAVHESRLSSLVLARCKIGVRPHKQSAGACDFRVFSERLLVKTEPRLPLARRSRPPGLPHGAGSKRQPHHTQRRDGESHGEARLRCHGLGGAVRQAAALERGG